MTVNGLQMICVHTIMQTMLKVWSWFKARLWRRKRRRSSARSLETARFIHYNSGFDAAEARFDDRNDESIEMGPQSSESSSRIVWSDHLRTILIGTRCSESPLSMLRGFEDTLVRSIYTKVVSDWKSYITATLPAHEVGRMNAHDAVENEVQGDLTRDNNFRELLDEELYEDPDFCYGERAASVRVNNQTFSILGLSVKNRPRVAFTTCSKVVEFPTPRALNVKMLPFIMGDRNSLSKDLQPYYDKCILRCAVMPPEIGQVCYLTVMDGFRTTTKQLRVEALESKLSNESGFVASVEVEQAPRWWVPTTRDKLQGGLFMACNTAEMCSVWNALVDTSTDFDSRQGIEHIRPYLGRARKLDANELVWLTAETPYEVMWENHGCQQFFCLVTRKIGVWYEDHWTPNPMVPLPSTVRVVTA